MKKYNITVNGTTYEVMVEEVGTVASAPAVVSAPAAAPIAAPAPVAAAPAAAPTPKLASAPAGGTPVESPIPGTVLEVKCKAGDTVKKGQTIFVVEALKMENDIPAPADGVITAVNATKGASVQAGEALAYMA